MKFFEANPYPINSFPYDLAKLASEVNQMTMTPSAIPGMSILAALSVCCQGLVDVRLPVGGNPLRPVSLNLLLVGESGERRSSVDSLVCAPIYAHDEQATKAYESSLNRHAGEREVWQAVKKGLVRQASRAELSGKPDDTLVEKLNAHMANPPKAPRLRRFIRQNSTERATFESLQGDGESIAFMTDEGQIMFDSSMMRNLGLSNKLWDGARVLTLDRAEFDNIVVLNPRATYWIMTHEAVMRKYMSKHGDNALGSGHLARYLVAQPDSTKGFRIDWSYSPFKSVELPVFHKRLEALLEKHARKRAADDFSRDELEFDNEATAYWREVSRMVEADLKPGSALSDISDFASKYMEIMSRIAALFHYYSGSKDDKISKPTLDCAYRIATWHLNEYQRLLGEGQPNPKEDAKELFDYLHQAYWTQGIFRILPSTLLHEGPVPLRKRWRRDAALNVLREMGAIDIEFENPIRQTKPRILLNDTFFRQGGPSSL